VHRRENFKAEAILIDKLHEKVAIGKIELKLFSTLDEVLVTRQVKPRATENTGRQHRNPDFKGCSIASPPTQHRHFFGQLDMRDGYIITKKSWPVRAFSPR
jgi:thioredoxin reductase (NADPH)